MQWTLDTGETEVGLRLGNALLNYWLRRGGRSEASKWMLALLAHPQGAVSISVRAKALLSTGIMLRIQDTLPSRLYFEEAIALCRQCGDDKTLGRAFTQLSKCASSEGDRQVTYREEALHYAQRAKDEWQIAILLEEALRQLIALENRIQLVAALNLLLALAIEQGKPIAALHLAGAIESIHPTVDAAQMFKIPTHVMEKLAPIQHLVDSHTITETWQHGTSHALDSSIVRSLFV